MTYWILNRYLRCTTLISNKQHGPPSKFTFGSMIKSNTTQFFITIVFWSNLPVAQNLQWGPIGCCACNLNVAQEMVINLRCQVMQAISFLGKTFFFLNKLRCQEISTLIVREGVSLCWFFWWNKNSPVPTPGVYGEVFWDRKINTQSNVDWFVTEINM